MKCKVNQDLNAHNKAMDEQDEKDMILDTIVQEIIEGDSFHELFCDEILQDKAIKFIKELITSRFLSVKLEALTELRGEVERVAKPVAEKLLEDKT